MRAFQLLVLAVVAYVGYVLWVNHHRLVVQQMADATPEPVAAVATPTAAPRPSATPALLVAVAPQRHLAPEGTYYLLQRVSFMTDSGVVGDAPGTKVSAVTSGTATASTAGAGTMRVTDGTNEFDVTAAQVTNDLDVAQRVFAADQAAQRSVTSQNAQRAAESERELTAAIKAQQAQQAQLQQQQQAVAPRPAGGSALDLGGLNAPTRAVSAPDGSGQFRSRVH